MGHFTGPDVTSNSSVVPENHIGTNVAFSTYGHTGTVSGSTSFSMCRIPAGAKVTGATLTWDNNAIAGTSAEATVALLSYTNGNNNGNILTSSLVSVNPLSTGVSYEILNYRHTASSQAVVLLSNFAGSTGTATTIFTLQLNYVCQNDGD